MIITLKSLVQYKFFYTTIVVFVAHTYQLYERIILAFAELLSKINSKSAKVGIIGLGYVGLPLLLRYAQVGCNVIGFDIDQAKIDNIHAKKSYIAHFSDDAIAEAMKSKADATTDFSRVAECDALIICVPTPLNKYREPDLSFVTSTLDDLQPYLRSGQVISLESTTWPGTTEEVVAPKVTASELEIGEDIFVVFSPEREDPGNKSFETHTIPKIVGGMTPDCLKIGIALYELSINKVVPVSSTKAAEMTKLLENIHRAVNIGLVNEMKIVADRMGLDIFEIIDAAATKPFGFTPYYPGPGLGGHCIPIDPFYLTWKAREYGLHTKFIELSGEINQGMPEYVIKKLIDALNLSGKPLMGSKVMVLGIAYKKNVDDMRESPSVQLMEILEKNGVIISYSDPHVPVFPEMREHQFELSSTDLTAENLGSQDAIIIATNHSAFNYDFICKHSQLIIDTRGVYRDQQNHIFRA